MNHALEITNLSKSYGSTKAIDNITLTVQEGEFFGLLGQNGAGKTTTINCTTGISNFTEGAINVFGIDVQKEYRKAREMIGLSPQEFNVDIFASIEKILDYVGGYFGMNKQQRKNRTDELITMLGLEEHRKKPFQGLSGGYKRRAILARALMHDPKLLILDEPTAGIDVEQRHMLWKQLQELHKNGKTIILTSHYLEEVELLTNRVAIMHKGKIMKEFTKDQYTGEGKTLEKLYLETTKG